MFVPACAPGGGETSDDSELSAFAADVSISGRVLENVQACTVDAVCFLRLQFADTSVVATYGSGERPAPPCDISRETSDAAFRVEAGDIITVRVAPCGREGLYLSELIDGGG